VRNGLSVRVGRVGERNDHDDDLVFTPAERMAMVWDLTVQAWAVKCAAEGRRFDAESHLIRNKRATGRPRDLDDAQRLTDQGSH
jgi:hypothetical protein